MCMNYVSMKSYKYFRQEQQWNGSRSHSDDSEETSVWEQAKNIVVYIDAAISFGLKFRIK